ncbi:hypothetical protein ACFQH5_13445 [Halomonas salifodinae]|uniref:Uncharacterized protein n=1 Tax=Halomonas salifodinae TaxID=438745 RepID=A0ABW2F0G7_9GAMM
MPISDDLAQLQPLLSRGYDCRLSPEVAREIAGIVSDHHGNREDLLSALRLIDQLHRAAGDADHAMTTPELAIHVRQILAWAEFAQRLMEAIARDGLGPEARKALESAPVDVREVSQ